MVRILIADDEPSVIEFLVRICNKCGYESLVARNGVEALDIARHTQPDLIILDECMPEMTGREVCRHLREDVRLADVPILFLTGMTSIDDKVLGLQAGANDFVTKPFDTQALVSRIEALLRRDSWQDSEPSLEVCEPPPLRLDFATLSAVVAGKAIPLTSTEFTLLTYLADGHSETVSTERILVDVWGYSPGTGDPALVRKHVHNIRDKIEPNKEEPIYLRTDSGKGYSLRVLADRSAARICVVDDESDLVWIIGHKLRLAGFQVVTALTGADALQKMRQQRPDLVILDVMLPDIDGLEVCQWMRADASLRTVPVLFLTVLRELEDEIQALDIGGDDFLSKPFDLRELQARVEALLAQQLRPSRPVYRGQVVLETKQRRVTAGEQSASLTSREFELLQHLLEHVGEVVPSQRLLERVWNCPPGTGNTSVVRWHVKGLRSKLDLLPSDEIRLDTVKGLGYVLRCSGN